ncbi:unnamed protein product [Bursaphelenchus okinawaensis]|uniref:diacylglycerol cholinephosphotransferase n=1 Tax=Bursaphelenchus okinawaensis TaxID=465554 RepID=A0A811JW06_9BILA|nr:unnamed protein product [Bursaphelenchus okinawaensis]CAG9085870.1 unnamed protein product [Bursaphelenchus okinawaensis]
MIRQGTKLVQNHRINNNTIATSKSEDRTRSPAYEGAAPEQLVCIDSNRVEIVVEKHHPFFEMPVQTRARRLVSSQSPVQQKKAFKIWQYLRSTVDNVCDAYIEKDCRLDHQQLQGLRDHKYASAGYSFMDDLCMQRFWNWVVEYYPMWLAPNLITLIGLIINLLTVLVLSHYCYTATEEAPRWAYLLAALGLFCYQTLDATDGKQARRTGSSSPLGELFDHGCDSMTQVFVTLNMCFAFQLGLMKNMVWIAVMISVSTFYVAHWSTFCTGHLKFNRFDVTEAQDVIISVLLSTTLFGPSVWDTSIFGIITVKTLMLSGGCLGMINQVVVYLKSIFSEGSGKNGSTVADTSVIFPLFPLLSVLLPFCMIYSKSTSGIYDANITLFALCFAAVGAKATNRLVVAHMSRSPVGIWDWIYLSPLLMIINQYYDFYFDELKILVIATIYAYLSLLVYCVYICHQFCNYLDIYCFKIRRSAQSPTTSSSITKRSSETKRNR